MEQASVSTIGYVQPARSVVEESSVSTSGYAVNARSWMIDAKGAV